MRGSPTSFSANRSSSFRVRRSWAGACVVSASAPSTSRGRIVIQHLARKGGVVMDRGGCACQTDGILRRSMLSTPAVVLLAALAQAQAPPAPDTYGDLAVELL